MATRVKIYLPEFLERPEEATNKLNEAQRKPTKALERSPQLLGRPKEDQVMSLQMLERPTGVQGELTKQPFVASGNGQKRLDADSSPSLPASSRPLLTQSRPLLTSVRPLVTSSPTITSQPLLFTPRTRDPLASIGGPF